MPCEGYYSKEERRPPRPRERDGLILLSSFAFLNLERRSAPRPSANEVGVRRREGQ